MLIQKLRLKRGWSQRQLAEASGLSTRTIQRIEAGQAPSIESLKSIAAVFEVDFSTLQPEADMATTETTNDEAREVAAFAHVRKLRGFYLHCLRYLVAVLVLTALNLMLTPTRLWVVWVIGGWGLGLALHGLRVFGGRRLLGPEWEKRQVERYLGRPL